MTANEMYDNFQIEYDRVASSAVKGWEPEEVAYFINVYSSDLLRIKTEAPDNADRQSYIFPFKKNETLTLSASQEGSLGPNSFLYNVPSDYPGRSEKEVVIWRNCDFNSPVTPLTDDEYFGINLDANRKSYIEELKRMLIVDEGQPKFELFLPEDGNFKVKKYLITYLREPVPVVINLDSPQLQVNSEYSSNKHYEIVRGAVLYALEAASDARLQTFPLKPLNFYRGNPQNN